MGTPNTTASTNHQAAVIEAAAIPGHIDGERLAEIDGILSGLTDRDRAEAAESAQALASQKAFLTEFSSVCQDQVKPVMQAVLDRLEANGGGGLIEHHPGGEPRVATPRLTLWMSLQGQIVGSPRPDQLPYLQFDAEVATREVRLTEGDMWRGGGGGHSGPIGSWQLSDVTQTRVFDQLLAILKRSAPSSGADRSAPNPE